MTQKKKNKKLLLLPIILPLLTGCSMTEYVIQEGTFNIDGMCSNFFTNVALSILEFFNSLLAGAYGLVQNTATDTYGTVNDFFTSMTSFGGLITVVSVLAVCAIVGNFAYGVFKNYLSEADNRYAPDVMAMLKRIIVAAVITFAFPYCVITGFMVASAGGSMVADAIFDNGAASFQIYDYMAKTGVSFKTYCSVGQERAGVKDMSGFYGYDPSEKDSNIGIEIITPNSTLETPDGSSAYSYYCQGAGGLGEDEALNVWQAFIYSPNTENVVQIGGHTDDHTTIIAEVTNLIGDALLLFGWVAILLVSMYCIAKRVVDLLMVILMGWWYIGKSLSDQGGESVGALVRKALCLMLTQFLFVMELAIFLTVFMQFNGNIIIKGFLAIAGAFTLLGTPTAVQELVTPTGGVGQVTKATKAVASGISKFIS